MTTVSNQDWAQPIAGATSALRRRSHRAGVAAFSLGAGLLLSACTTSSYNCTNSGCDVSLRGNGSSTDFGQDGGATVQLVSSADGVATIAYDGQQGSCSSGETIGLGQASVECTEVGDGSVDLIISR